MRIPSTITKYLSAVLVANIPGTVALASCPQLFLDHGDNALNLTLEAPDDWDEEPAYNYLWAVTADDGGRSPATANNNGYVVSNTTTKIFWVGAKDAIPSLAAYQIELDGSKGATFVHHPDEVSLTAAQLPDVPGNAQACTLDVEH